MTQCIDLYFKIGAKKPMDRKEPFCNKLLLSSLPFSLKANPTSPMVKIFFKYIPYPASACKKDILRPYRFMRDYYIDASYISCNHHKFLFVNSFF